MSLRAWRGNRTEACRLCIACDCRARAHPSLAPRNDIFLFSRQLEWYQSLLNTEGLFCDAKQPLGYSFPLGG